MAKVLIVDDSAFIRSILDDIVLKKKLEIIEATNVDEAIDFYINEQPSLVFMDIILQNDGRT
ncbi:MAG: response regulator, partial [Candidatus Woesearchaeota archaeon]